MNDTPTAAPMRDDATQAIEAAARYVLENSRRSKAALSNEQRDADASQLMEAYRDIIGKAIASGHLAHTARPDAGDTCDACGGYGEYFGHADDCRDDSCALAGGIDDCNGKVIFCGCDTLTASPDAKDEDVERVARAMLFAKWERDGGYHMSSAISRDLYIDKRWRDVADDARAALAAMPDRATTSTSTDGYATAFYEIAKMLRIGARAKSPFEVWRDEMKPKLEALIARADGKTEDAERLRDALKPFAVLAAKVDVGSRTIVGVGLDGLLPEATLPVGGEGISKECAITVGNLVNARAALAATDIPTPPRAYWKVETDSEGWASSLSINTRRAAAAELDQRAKQPSRFDPPGLWESEPRSSADDAGEVIR